MRRLKQSSVAALVKKYPGKTSTELAHLTPKSNRISPGAMNAALRELSNNNRINRISEPGINPKRKALRHYPVTSIPLVPTLQDKKYWCREPFTFGLGLPYFNQNEKDPEQFYQIMKLVQKALPEVSDFTELVIAIMPLLHPDAIAKIVADATTARLSS